VALGHRNTGTCQAATSTALAKAMSAGSGSSSGRLVRSALRENRFYREH
jgi:hypothetical protein